MQSRDQTSTSLSALVTCPSCASEFSAARKFCPTCQLPRTAVAVELRRTSELTGIPFAELRQRGWEDEQRNPPPESQENDQGENANNHPNKNGELVAHDVAVASVQHRQDPEWPYRVLTAAVWLVVGFLVGQLASMAVYVGLSALTGVDSEPARVLPPIVALGTWVAVGVTGYRSGLSGLRNHLSRSFAGLALGWWIVGLLFLGAATFGAILTAIPSAFDQSHEVTLTVDAPTLPGSNLEIYYRVGHGEVNQSVKRDQVDTWHRTITVDEGDTVRLWVAYPEGFMLHPLLQSLSDQTVTCRMFVDGELWMQGTIDPPFTERCQTSL